MAEELLGVESLGAQRCLASWGCGLHSPLPMGPGVPQLSPFLGLGGKLPILGQGQPETEAVPWVGCPPSWALCPCCVGSAGLQYQHSVLTRFTDGETEAQITPEQGAESAPSLAGGAPRPRVS